MGPLERAWYQGSAWLRLLLPIAWVLQGLAAIRRRRFAGGRRNLAAVPIRIVVGNLTVGGTGKTALLIELANGLESVGLKVGVVSRGYRSKAPHYPYWVAQDGDAGLCGDEPLLIAQRTGCPVVIDPDRERAVRQLAERSSCQVVLSDDGLQHYPMARDIEIVVVDGERGFGNGWCLPAGPLREPVTRLRSVDHVVVNGGAPGIVPAGLSVTEMHYEPRFLINVLSGERKPFKGAPFHIGSTVHAVSGVGNPSRFHALLGTLPYALETHVFPDHHAFRLEDLVAIDSHQPIVMTEKDAVKCRGFARSNWWYLAIDVRLSAGFMERVTGQVQTLLAAASPSSGEPDA